ncbi:MAG: fused MFS/spermidine synthase [Syntrophobacteraceae bacterium]
MLELIVFACGAAVMILEMVGARIVAPYLGSSIVVWTALIGTILASLSVGYWWGGKIADRKPNAKAFSIILLLSGVSVALLALAKAMILDFWDVAALPVQLGATAFNLALFAPSTVCLGMVSPYAVRLKLSSVEQAGSTAGRLYAISTFGSIMGTFVAGFYLIATFGSTAILLGLSLSLVLLSILASEANRKRKASVLLVPVLFFILCSVYEEQLSRSGFYDLDTSYNRVLVFQSKDDRTDRPTRAMATTPRYVHSSMYLDDPQKLVLRYTRFFTLAEYWRPRMTRALVLGGGAYSFPRYLLSRHPQLHMDVVELDPGVTDIARRFFHLEDMPGLRIHHEDARTFINRDQEPYDVIFMDVFNSQYSVPFHLTTLETVTRLHGLLKEDGIVIMNAISAIEGPLGRFLRAEAATYRAVFKQVHLYPLFAAADGARKQNVLLVATKSEDELPTSPPDDELAGYLAGRWRQPLETDVPVLTDDYAPVEVYVAGIER